MCIITEGHYRREIKRNARRSEYDKDPYCYRCIENTAF